MAVLKICGIGDQEKYRDDDTIEDVINYCGNPEKLYRCGGINVNPYNAVVEMSVVADEFMRDHGRRVRHMVLSFSELPLIDNLIADSASLTTAFAIAHKVALFYLGRHQIAYFVHANTQYAHIHFVMNTVNFSNGKKYHGEREDYHAFVAHVRRVLSAYNMDMRVIYDGKQANP